MKKVLVFLSLLSVGMPSLSYAFRCEDGDLVHVGDSDYAVQKCGTPLAQGSIVNSRGVTIGRWVQLSDVISTRTVYTVKIVGGKVVSIESERR